MVGYNGLKDKTVIVTGATSGIGDAVARFLAKAGSNLVLVARRQELGDQLVEELGKEKTVFVSGDVADPNTAKRAIDVAINTFGELNILINNAAMDFDCDILETRLEEARKVFDINFFGAFNMLQQCALSMKEKGGSIVNVTSRNASVAIPGLGVYGASKNALLAVTRSAAVELAHFNIRVNAVAPGLTDTPLVRAWIDEQPDPQSFEKTVADGTPQKRMARPEEVAKAIVFLASDEASHITGTSLAVDGGYTAQ